MSALQDESTNDMVCPHVHAVDGGLMASQDRVTQLQDGILSVRSPSPCSTPRTPS